MASQTSWKDTLAQLDEEAGWEITSSGSWADDVEEEEETNPLPSQPASSPSHPPGDDDDTDDEDQQDNLLASPGRYQYFPDPHLSDLAEQDRERRRESLELFGWYGAHPDGFPLYHQPPDPGSKELVGGPLPPPHPPPLPLAAAPVPALVVTTPEGYTLYPYDVWEWPAAVAYGDEEPSDDEIQSDDDEEQPVLVMRERKSVDTKFVDKRPINELGHSLASFFSVLFFLLSFFFSFDILV